MSALRDLLTARVSGDARPTFRYQFCLDPEAYAEWEMARDELAEIPAPEVDSEGAAKTERLGGPRSRLAREVAELEARVRAATVTGVFKALTPDGMGALLDRWDKEKIVGAPDRARSLIVECFVRFATDDGPVAEEDLGRADLEKLVGVLGQGELYGLSNRLTELTNSVLDLPKSVRPSGAASAFVRNSTPA